MPNWTAAAILLAAVAATPARADLSLGSVTELLKTAHVESAWSIVQFSQANDPTSLEIVAHTGKVQLAKDLCRTEETTFELDVSAGSVRLLSTSSKSLYAFMPCNSAGFADQFHSVTGEFEPKRLAQDVQIAVDYMADCRRDPSTQVKVSNEWLRPYIGKLFVQNVYDVEVSEDGVVKVNYIAPILDLNEVGVTVEHEADGSIKLAVELIAQIDVVAIPQ